MKTFSSIIAIIYFLINEIPKFLEAWRRSQKNKTYKDYKEALDNAYKEYRKDPTLEKLKEFEKAQTK